MTVPRKLAVSALLLVMPFLVALGHLIWADAAPDPMPSHWGLNGVDDITAARTYFIVSLSITGALALATVAVTWLSISAFAGRMLTSILAFGTWIAGVPYLASLLLARNIVDPYQVPMPWLGVLSIAGLPILLAVTVYLLHPSTGVERPQVEREVMPLGPTERVAWIGHAGSAPLRVVAVALVAAAVAITFFRIYAVAIPLGVIGVALTWASVIAVRVDRRGVHTLWGPFGWPHPYIRLNNVAAADAQDIKPMQWGGWGYRVSSRGTAAVVRGGPGLVIQRLHGPTYAVTVDGAEEAARVLNALLARHQ